MQLLRRRRVRRSLIAAVLVLGALTWWLARGDAEPAYVPGEHTEGLVDSLGRRLPEDTPPIVFREVAAASGLAFRHFPATRANRLPEDMGSGVALGDVDGDGDTDAYLVDVAGSLGRAAGERDLPGRCRLFVSEGDGTFRDATEASGAGLRVLGMAAAFLDKEGDGDLDLFVTSYGRCHLLENDGAGRFTDVSAAAGIDAPDGFWSGLAVGDADGDDDLDVYVCGYVEYDEDLTGGASAKRQYGAEIPAPINPSVFPPAPNLLYVNRGDGTFDERAEEAGVRDARGRGLGACFADLTGDGRLDLYVANDVSDNAFYVNRGDGTFEDVAARALVGDYRGAMGLAVGDFDADLDPDLFITHWVAQENALYENMADTAGPGEEAPVLFMDVADRHGLGQVALPMVGWATGFTDVDLDGRLDLLVVNGSTIPRDDDPTRLAPQPMQLFWNAGATGDGARGYFELGAHAGEVFGRELVGRGGALLDLERDGDEDVIVVAHGGDALLLRNDTPPRGHTLTVRLRQPAGNTFAVGARVVVEAGGRRRVRWTGTQGSYLSQHAVGELVVGLGEAERVERLEVTWPDGQTDRVRDVGADRLVTWVRGSPPDVAWLTGRVAAWRASARTPPADPSERRRFHELQGRAAHARIAGEPARAAALYAEALALWPGHEDCLYYRANCALEQGDETGALEGFERLVSVHPSSSKGWMQIGRLRQPGGQARLDDLDAAHAAFERAHEINGEQSGPVLHLGLVALLAGELETADAWLADAAALNTADVAARYYRGYVAWRRGRPDAAAARLAEAREALDARHGGGSVSSEGDTATGRALVATRRGGGHPGLARWRTLADRDLDADAEYAALQALLSPGAGGR